MTVIKQDDLIQSIADALQFISYYHPTDFIRAMRGAWEKEESPAAKAALTNYLMPVFTALLGWVLLNESLQLYHWLGAAMIFGGLLLATRPGKTL